jgi:hypothetical protein
MGYSEYGDGKAIIEILNIGFEPLLTPKEYKLFIHIGLIRYKISTLTYSIKILNKILSDTNRAIENNKWFQTLKDGNIKRIELLESLQKKKEVSFREELTVNKNTIRNIYPDRKFKHDDQFRNIAIFESDLTRCFGYSDLDHCGDIISVVTYYTEIFESIMMNGFNYNEKHFVFFTAGAGQTRTKKSTFVSEDKLNQNFNKLFCGLTREDINKQGGMNTNKYLAYTSLCQTNSEIWSNFNIDRAIVVEDIEYNIPNQKVRYIYTESPEDKLAIENLTIEANNIKIKLKETKSNKAVEESENEINFRHRLKEINNEINSIKEKFHKAEIQNRDITIPFTDGFGISLKKMQSAMIRLPFIKGLIAYTPRKSFKDWCRENNKKIKKITDIYGVDHSIDDIDYIFTKSQFKMYKYYNNICGDNGVLVKSGWEIYKDNFKKYNSCACICNVEKNVKLNAKTNYQILQTLTTEMTDEEIKELAAYDIDNLNGIGNDVQCMLNILGANTEKNNKLNNFQLSLLLYPEMLKDYYVKSSLKNTKDSMTKKFRSGKFNIEGSYTYAIPDVLACLQWWFNEERDIEKLGFVKEGEVYCELFEDNEQVDCLRSPHLDHAHCIRKNIKRESDQRFVKSKGVYIGIKDIMSKLLMFDNDGDKLLIHRNKVIIECALRFQEKYGIIPNYYDMPKANAQLITNKSLFEGIVLAYHHGNIGTPSNEITKIFMTLNTNSKEQDIKEAIEIVALRVVDVNFTIDFAKTLYKPTIPKNVIAKYKKYSGKKIPHFFMYAKKKSKNQVEVVSDCNIDRITNIVKSNRIVFKDLLGKYSYKILMNNPNVDINTEKAKKILELYHSINDANIRRLTYIDFNSLEIEEKNRVKLQLEFDSNKQRELFLANANINKEYATDVLIKSLQDDVKKDTLWRLFGDVIYENIKRNIDGTKICDICKKRFNVEKKVGKPNVYCIECAKKKELESAKKRMKKMRNTNI